MPGPEIARVQAAAKEAAVAVVLGISERDQGTCYNTQVFIERDGSLLGIHRKLQPTYAERFIWGQGDGSTLSVFDSSVGRLGGLACWEHTKIADVKLFVDSAGHYSRPEVLSLNFDAGAKTPLRRV